MLLPGPSRTRTRRSGRIAAGNEGDVVAVDDAAVAEVSETAETSSEAVAETTLLQRGRQIAENAATAETSTEAARSQNSGSCRARCRNRNSGTAESAVAESAPVEAGNGS